MVYGRCVLQTHVIIFVFFFLKITTSTFDINVTLSSQYLKGPLLDGLYTEKWYNDDDVKHFGYILHESKLLGIPRMRQIKVSQNVAAKINKIL